MSDTTLCPKCGVVLNLPDGIAGRRLRCPKCGERFLVGGVPAVPAPPPGPKPPTPQSPPADTRRPTSSLMLTESGETQMPRSDRDLRETFSPDLLMSAEDTPPKKKPGSGSGSGPEIADAASLLGEDEPTPRKRRRDEKLAEGRSKARRCPSCGGVVPIGMSLCGQCGLDLDTGQRTLLDEILETAPVPKRKQGTPIGIMVVGGVVLFVSAMLTMLALVQATRQEAESTGPLSRQNGFLSLALVGGFCIYAAVQFLRGRSLKLLIVALMIGGAVDLVGMIGLPLYFTLNATEVVDSHRVGIDDEDLPAIQNVAQELDARIITWGIALLLCDAAAMVYLLSPRVNRHFERARPTSPVAIT